MSIDTVPIIGKKKAGVIRSKKGTFTKPFIMMDGLKAAIHARKVLIRTVVQAWINRDPRVARKFADFLHNITAVEHSSGQWRHANAHCKVRLPQELFLTLRAAFDQNLPDEPCFGDDDSDVYILYTEFPKLLPNPERARRIMAKGVIF